MCSAGEGKSELVQGEGVVLEGAIEGSGRGGDVWRGTARDGEGMKHQSMDTLFHSSILFPPA